MSDTLNEALAVLNEKLAGSDFAGSAKFDVEGEGAIIIDDPIKPEDAVILPSNVAPLAIKIPSLSTIKFGPILM